MEDITNLMEKAKTAHEIDFDWCQGYMAYNSDFEWSDNKPEMWKLGYLYGFINQKGGAIPQ